LDRDEAIVAIFAHEMHELTSLKPLMDEGVLTIEDFIDVFQAISTMKLGMSRMFM
jgi:hypothetical protein